MDSHEKKPEPLAPSSGEHGVYGYTQDPVGGFGEGYAAQVAHGGDGDSPRTQVDSELDLGAADAGPAELEQSVRKTLAGAHIDAADLRVQAVGTEIHLRGTVRHLHEKAELEARARAVPGVTAVVSELSARRASWGEDT